MGSVIERKISEKDIKLLLECSKIAEKALKKGNHPFGALLADGYGNILMRQGNAFQDGGSSYHAELRLVMRAAKKYPPEFLKNCTLYTNFEPCVMCTGSIYWSNIGRVCYALSEKTLLKLTGANEENPTFSLDCRTVFKAGQKDVVVSGPIDEDSQYYNLFVKDHKNFW